jgi:hypothetical protein
VTGCSSARTPAHAGGDDGQLCIVGDSTKDHFRFQSSRFSFGWIAACSSPSGRSADEHLLLNWGLQKRLSVGVDGVPSHIRRFKQLLVEQTVHSVASCTAYSIHSDARLKRLKQRSKFLFSSLSWDLLVGYNSLLFIRELKDTFNQMAHDAIFFHDIFNLPPCTMREASV